VHFTNQTVIQDYEANAITTEPILVVRDRFFGRVPSSLTFDKTLTAVF